jgi:hypothetical protein
MEEPNYCAVCGSELSLDESKWLQTPKGEAIEVCAACFDMKPEDYKPLDNAN